MGVTRYWRYSKSKMEGLIAKGRIIQTKPGSVPQYKRYLDEMPGVPNQNLWDDISPINSQARERFCLLYTSYGAFGSITRPRYEVIVEGTDEPAPTASTKWREYEFKGKPGGLARMPPQIAPYHLRLDWLMWFAALSSYEDQPWFAPFMQKLLEGDRPVLSLPVSYTHLQSNDNNILVHIGRNPTSSALFLTRYRNGVRLGLDEAILDYQDCRELPVELTIDNQYSVSLTIENKLVYETFVDREIKAQVVLLAWGDDHEYEIDFKHIRLQIG